MEKGADEGVKIGGSGCVAQAQGQGQLRRQVVATAVHLHKISFSILYLIPRH